MDEQANFGISDKTLVMSDLGSRNRKPVEAEERRRLKMTKAWFYESTEPSGINHDG